MFDKIILEKGEMLRFFPDWYKNQKMCDKTVSNYIHAVEFVPDCYKTQKICGKAVDICPSAM